MGLFDRLFGRLFVQPANTGTTTRLPQAQREALGLGTPPDQLSDQQALARYRYMIQTAPPEQIEQAHAEAFAKLTPAQRAQLLEQMTQSLPASEVAGLQSGQNDPRTLARVATRAEMRNPGYMEQNFGPQGRYGAVGGGMMNSFFGTMVASFAGSMIAMSLFDALDGGFADMPMDSGDAGGDMADSGDVGGDFGGDFGDFGGDFGEF